MEKGKAAKLDIERKSRHNVDVIQLFKLDIGSYNSIKNFVKDAAAKFLKINAALLNAGEATAAYNLSCDGYEMSIQVNAVSTAHLAILLLRIL